MVLCSDFDKAVLAICQMFCQKKNGGKPMFCMRIQREPETAEKNIAKGLLPCRMDIHQQPARRMLMAGDRACSDPRDACSSLHQEWGWQRDCIFFSSFGVKLQLRKDEAVAKRFLL